MNLKTSNYSSLQAAMNAAAGRELLLDEDAIITSSLLIPNAGINLRGDKTTITFTGTGEAIKLGGDWTSGVNKIKLRDFHLVGNESATNGIDLTGASKYGALIDGLRISGFTGYALAMTNVYSVLITRLHTDIDNKSGVFIGGVAVNLTIRDSWIKFGDFYGVHIDSASSSKIKIESCIFDTLSRTPPRPDTQVAIQIDNGDVILEDIHIEDVYKPFDIQTGRLVCRNVRLNSHDTAPTIADGAYVVLDSVEAGLTTSLAIQARLGTIWNDGQGHIVPPTVTESDLLSNALSYASSVMVFDFQSPTDFHGFSEAYRHIDEFVIISKSVNCVLKHRQPGVAGQLHLRNGENRTMAVDEVVTFRKAMLDGDGLRWFYYEV